jgi:superfamily II DNA or RNA helicase
MTEDIPVEQKKQWRSSNVWAKSDKFEGNAVKQLLVPASSFDTVKGNGDQLLVQNAHGTWPAHIVGATPPPGLALQLPLGSKVGDAIRGASWHGELARVAPDQVLETYRGGLTFSEEVAGSPGLRRPQLGAVHAVLGHWTTGRVQPATVVMPTGTGKTETMLALLVAARPERLLVLVPTDALRTQVAGKFESLGVLQAFGIVQPTAMRPVVGRIDGSFSSAKVASAFAAACNVIVTTPDALTASSEAARAALLDSCSHLFVDEAHHVAAPTWSHIREAFNDKHVVQFTATPFREDGKHLAGKTIYAFPLGEAQRDGYFAPIEYRSVIDFEDTDKALAEQAVARLRQDIDRGLDHVLMVRTKSIPRAHEVKPYYDAIAADLKPAIINSRMPKKGQAAALQALYARDSRIVICVSMLGEGFDLPALKVAAVHDAQKSLGVTLQFIGRFARTSSTSEYGDASVFVARREIDIDRRLKSLYAEDADWNLVLRDLTETAVDAQQAVSDFEAGFVSQPEEVTLRNLLPKMSTVVYRTESKRWTPDAIVDYFGEDSLLTMPIGYNPEAGVAWCVVENRSSVRWGDLRTIEEINYELYVLYFDSKRRLLYINHSANEGLFEELAVAVAGPGVERFNGSSVYRVMADIQRLVPTNVGVLDVHDQFRRFSMHVGSDVTASFSQAEAGTKSKTNISGGGYREGEHVNISASIKGRIWSHNTAPSLKHWCDWCDGIGTKLLDSSISIDDVIGQFILPENMTDRPESVLLALEWPWATRLLQADNLQLALAEKSYPLVSVDLVPDTSSTTGPFRFTAHTEAWSVTYEASFVKSKLQYRSVGSDDLLVRTVRSERPFSEWLNEHGLLLILDGDRVIEGNLLYRAKFDKPPFAKEALTVRDWAGVDIDVEAQRAEKRPNSIQYAVIKAMQAEDPAWDVILDDDGSGEIADVVGLRIDADGLKVRFVHCKFSSDAKPGARLADLYEVCGQAQKSVFWRKSDMLPFFKALEYRARQKQKRTGVSPFEVGDIRALYRLQQQAQVLLRNVEVMIVQPGLSAAKATSGQLELLASTEAYLRTTINAPLTVWCSA